MKTNFFYFLLLMGLMACKKTETVAPIPVTPTPILSGAREITAFSFTKAINTSLSADVIATIDAMNHTISATFPAGTVITVLKASFTISADASLKVGSTVQTTAVTPNDFTNPLTFTVTAQNATIQNYTVTIKVETATSTTSNLVIKREEFAPGPPIQTVPVLTADYTYNNSNVLTGFKDNYGTYLFDYDANGNLKTQTVKDNNGNITNTFTYSLNTNKLPTTISGTYGQTVETYNYGTSGQPIKYTKSYFGAVKDTYDYTTDGKGRIISAKYVSTNETAGIYTIYTYTYYDDVYDPDPMVKVAIRPGIAAGLDPSTGKTYALKSVGAQKYDANGAIGANTVRAYAYTTNANGYIISLSDGNGGALYRYTFK